MFDLNIDPNNPNGNPSAAELAALGVQMARFTYHDPTTDAPLNAQWLRRQQRKVQSLAQAGIRSLLILTYDTYPDHPGLSGSGEAWNTYLRHFTRRAAALATALGPWRPAFQIWNEPDHPPTAGYAPSLPQNVYAEMLRRTAAAIRAVDPGLTLVGAGLSSGDDGWLAGVLGYLNHAYPVDVLAIHPYGQRPEPTWPTPTWLHGYVGDLLWRYRRVLRQPVPIWITEVGERYEVNTYHDRRAGQAEYMRRFYHAMANEYAGLVDRVAWFCYSDGMVSPFGLLEQNGRRKPAYETFRRLPQLVRLAYGVAYLSHNTPALMTTEETAAVQVQLKNTGTRIWLDSGPQRVQLTYRWLSLDGREVPPTQWQDRRTPLPANIHPDQKITLQAELQAPRVPGTYRLRWDLVEEMVTHFSWQGARPLEQRITVAPGDFLLDAINPLHPMRLSSSHNNLRSGPDGLQNVLDGNPHTRWSTRAPQRAGMWLKLDLGQVGRISHLRLDNEHSPDDYPRGYRVQVSLDDENWSTVAENPRNSGPLIITFSPRRTRYVRVELTAADPIRWWAVHDISVSDKVQYRATASHNNVQRGPDNVNQAIDGKPETRWSSRQVQQPGMWFVLDLQAVQTVRGVLAEHGEAAKDDYPRGYVVSVSQDGRRWAEVAREPDNAGYIDIRFSARPIRYIRFEQTGQAERHWWSISHIRLR